VSLQRAVCYRCDVDRRLAFEPALTEREIEERVDQALLLLAAGDDVLAHLAQCERVHVRIGERCLGQCELKRHLRAQFVRNERGETAVPV
jgi:hypothetical protein